MVLIASPMLTAGMLPMSSVDSTSETTVASRFLLFEVSSVLRMPETLTWLSVVTFLSAAGFCACGFFVDLVAACVVAAAAVDSLAAGLAREAGLTLVGFARAPRLTVYAGEHRLDLD